MPSSLFLNPRIIQQSLPTTAVQASVSLRIGGTLTSFNMVNVSQGQQRARLQVDATADGALYAIGCMGGIGIYEAEFLEGPYTRCTDSGSDGDIPDSLMRTYINLQTMSERKAEVTFFREGIGTSGGSSQSIGRFVGILNNMVVRLVDDQGMVYLSVAVNILGSWQP